MRILLLSYYYPPDIGPGALRAKSIVDALKSKALNKIDVITTAPNRYSLFHTHSKKLEYSNKIFIHRIKVPKHKNGIFDQIKTYFFFILAVKKLVKKKNWDIVIATSSRLMTASLGAWIAKNKNAKLYLDIRDLFVDTISSKYKKTPLYLLVPLIRILEKWTINSANKVNVVSAGFVEYVKKIKPKLLISVHTNGVDSIFLKKKFKKKKNILLKPLILYAGNIGEGQGLHKIVPKVASLLKSVDFKIIGDGSERKSLTNNKLLKTLSNIKILIPISRNKLIFEYQKADILFLHLNNYEAFNKVLPSKIFEYASTGKPILAGVSGYAAKFLKKEVSGVEVFDPLNYFQMKRSLLRLLNGPSFFDRSKFCNEFFRESIMKKFAKDILN
jgi:glycosyltransferase involved in cell wall biosynthesis